eukprot:14343027-Heterocapsa_arctica.AAC.1
METDRNQGYVWLRLAASGQDRAQDGRASLAVSGIYPNGQLQGHALNGGTTTTRDMAERLIAYA